MSCVTYTLARDTVSARGTCSIEWNYFLFWMFQLDRSRPKYVHRIDIGGQRLGRDAIDEECLAEFLNCNDLIDFWFKRPINYNTNGNEIRCSSDAADCRQRNTIFSIISLSIVLDLDSHLCSTEITSLRIFSSILFIMYYVLLLIHRSWIATCLISITSKPRRNHRNRSRWDVA